MRFDFSLRNNMPETAEDNKLYPLKVSRATANIDKIYDFYTEDIGAEVVNKTAENNGSPLAIMLWKTPEKVV